MTKMETRKKSKLNLKTLENIEVGGVDLIDYPDFSDSYYLSAYDTELGRDLTEDELDELTEKEPELLHELAVEAFYDFT